MNGKNHNLCDENLDSINLATFLFYFMHTITFSTVSTLSLTFLIMISLELLNEILLPSQQTKILKQAGWSISPVMVSPTRAPQNSPARALRAIPSSSPTPRQLPSAPQSSGVMPIKSAAADKVPIEGSIPGSTARRCTRLFPGMPQQTYYWIQLTYLALLSKIDKLPHQQKKPESTREIPWKGFSAVSMTY